MMRKAISISKGVLSNFLSNDAFIRSRGTGGTNSAVYCYGVWLKHLTFLWENGMQTIPKTMVEMGPGDSIGIGLAAMLSGVDNYFALDVVKFANKKRDLNMLDELIRLFKSRSPRPVKGFPDFDDLLDADLFPGHILTPEKLNASLSEERIKMIRDAIIGENNNHKGISIQYIVPWNIGSVPDKVPVNLVLSHAVLEYIEDLEYAYEAMYSWLEEGGSISHQIDFRSHGLSDKWNGHWTYSEPVWKVIKGNRPILINRQPYSVHHNLILRHGFTIKCNLKIYNKNDYKKTEIAARWKNMSDDDLSCSGAFIQAVKPITVTFHS